MLRQLMQPEIEEVIEAGAWQRLRDAVDEWPSADVAELLGHLDGSDRVLFFRALPREQAADVFSHLDPEEQNDLLRDLTDRETREILDRMAPDDRSILLEELPGEVTQRMLRLLDPEKLEEARELLGYPPESVGRLMTPEYVTVRPEWSVARALEHVRDEGPDSETVNMVYVADERGTLLDDLRLRTLVLADPEARVDDLMDRSYARLSAFQDREEAVREIQRYDLVALPVVDSQGMLLGIVTVDDLLDVAQAEATEDIQKGASVAPLEVGYRNTPITGLYGKRIGWLLGLVVLNLLSSGVIAAYEETLSGALALAFFIPLLIDTGGNTGAQSATLLIRALATEDVRMGEWALTLGKELAVGALLGGSLGVAAWAMGLFRGGTDIAVVVGLSMFSIVLVTNLVGMALPFVLDRVGVDPATASAPLVTSVADVGGLLIYFAIASRVLGV